jgi:hypothetical protein
MKFSLEGIFGGNKNDSNKEKYRRTNDGGDFMAVPGAVPGEVTEDEGRFAEARRNRIEQLHSEIEQLKAGPDFEGREDQINTLTSELHSIQEPFQ